MAQGNPGFFPKFFPQIATRTTDLGRNGIHRQISPEMPEDKLTNLGDGSRWCDDRIK